MNILIVDDEKLARSRLCTLLESVPGTTRVVEASSVAQALDILQKSGDLGFDFLLLDVQMPGMNGLAFARFLKNLPKAPAVIFVTAHPEFASQAFDLEAADYLTKPVRLERLEQALKRATRLQQSIPSAPAPAAKNTPALPEKDAPFIVVNERGRIERILIENIIYCKAEHKYVVLHTLQSEHLYDSSLNELEGLYPGFFLRIHRNALVARKAIRELHRSTSNEEGEQWFLGMHGRPEKLNISRRQLPAVRAALLGKS